MPPLAALVEQWPLASAWLLYSAAHSAFAADRCKSWIEARFPGVMPWYRLGFNLLALLLLLPIVALIWTQPGPLWWQWSGAAANVLNGVSLLAVALLAFAGPGYDLPRFLGLRRGLPNADSLRISTWHRHVRHPWYAVGLLLIWTRDMNSAWLVTCVCVTAYLIVGAWLEDRKLDAEFGPPYAAYRRRVPGLLPRLGRRLSAAEAAALERAAAERATAARAGDY